MDFKEEKTIDHLSHEITRLITRVDYHEKEISEHRKENDARFAKLELKIDELKDSFGEMRGDIKALLVRIGLFGAAGLVAIEIAGKVLKLW